MSLEQLRQRLRSLGERIQEFARSRRDAVNPLERPPDFFLQELHIDGEVQQSTARLRVTLTAVVTRDGQVPVPLNPVGVFTGSDGNLDTVEDGYLWWVQGKGRHQLKLDLLVELQTPLLGVGRLRMPPISPSRASISSLTLRVPGDPVEARTGDQRRLQVEAVEGNRSQIVWHGLPHEGRITLEWQQRPAGNGTPARIESEALWLVEVQQDRVDARVTLSLASSGRSFDQFQIRLPPGARAPSWKMVPGRKTENLIPSDRADEGAVLTVMLDEPTAGPLPVHLEFHHLIDSADGDFAIGGLIVLGAARQSGDLLVRTPESLDLLVNATESARQIQFRDLRQELKEGRGGLAFRYLRQPFRIELKARPQETRLGVTPQMVLMVAKQGPDVLAFLHARWTVSIQRAAIGAMHFSTAGWEIDPAQVRVVSAAAPEGGATQLMDRVTSGTDDSGRFRIQFAQPIRQSVRIELRAQRRLTAGSVVALPLPSAEQGSSGDTQVSIYAGDGVRVQPDYGAMPEVAPDFLPIEDPLPVPNSAVGFRRAPLTLRLRDARQPLALQVEAQPQSTQAGCSTRITVTSQAALVAQTYTFFVENEPLSKLQFDVPLSLWDASILVKEGLSGNEVQSRGQLLLSRVRGFSVQVDAETKESFWRADVAPGEPRLGRFQWQLTYELPLPRATAKAEELLIPLVMPVCNTMTFNDVELVVPPELRIDVAEGRRWRSAAGSSRGRALQLRSDGRTFAVALSISKWPQPAGEAVVISRAWLRTSVDVDGLQRYEGLFRIRTQEPSVSIRLPDGAQGSRVFGDGRPLPAETVAPGMLRVFLPGLPGSKRRPARSPVTAAETLLRVEYVRLPAHGWSRWMSSCQVAAPSFPGGRWEDRWYWQLILPKRQHLLSKSASYYTESRWRWQGLLWRRSPNRTSEELNGWVQSERPLPDPSADTNEYLFSCLGGSEFDAQPDRAAMSNSPVRSTGVLTLRTVTPPMLLMAASGCIVVCGVLLIQFRPARGLVWLVAVASAALFAASRYPSPAVLLLQSGIPGVALVVVAGLLKRNLQRLQQRGTLVSVERNNVLSIPSTMTAPPPQSAGSVGSTMTGSRSGIGSLQ